jgi:hypothetical protein
MYSQASINVPHIHTTVRSSRSQSHHRPLHTHDGCREVCQLAAERCARASPHLPSEPFRDKPIVIVQNLLAESGSRVEHLPLRAARLSPRRLKAGEPLVAAIHNRNRRLACLRGRMILRMYLFVGVG